jgi:hypothetical protein
MDSNCHGDQKELLHVPDEEDTVPSSDANHVAEEGEYRLNPKNSLSQLYIEFVSEYLASAGASISISCVPIIAFLSSSD